MENVTKIIDGEKWRYFLATLKNDLNGSEKWTGAWAKDSLESAKKEFWYQNEINPNGHLFTVIKIWTMGATEEDKKCIWQGKLKNGRWYE